MHPFAYPMRHGLPINRNTRGGYIISAHEIATGARRMTHKSVINSGPENVL